MEALGRSRGGLTTMPPRRRPAACPIARVATHGQRHDAVMFTAVLAAIGITRPGPAGAPPRTPTADKAYSSKAIRGLLRRRASATIPERADQRQRRACRGSEAGARQDSMPSG